MRGSDLPGCARAWEALHSPKDHTQTSFTNSQQPLEFCRRRRLGDCRNYWEDCLFSVLQQFLVASGCSVLAVQRFAAY